MILTLYGVKNFLIVRIMGGWMFILQSFELYLVNDIKVKALDLWFLNFVLLFEKWIGSFEKWFVVKWENQAFIANHVLNFLKRIITCFFTVVKCPVLNFTHKQKAFHQKRKQNKNGQLEADTAELETDRKPLISCVGGTRGAVREAQKAPKKEKKKKKEKRKKQVF